MVDPLHHLLQRCSVSSDSFGSLPVFDKGGKLVQYKVRRYWFFSPWSCLSASWKSALASLNTVNDSLCVQTEHGMPA